MPAHKKAAAKKWVGWFKPLTRGQRYGTLITSPIEVFREATPIKKLKRDSHRIDLNHDGLFQNQFKLIIVVSVPGVCGNAVLRNRFRRIVKARFAKSVFKDEIVAEYAKVKTEAREISAGGKKQGNEINPVPAQSADKSPPAKRRVKGIWIRLLNRHRLDRKILLKDWKKEFDAIESDFFQ